MAIYEAGAENFQKMRDIVRKAIRTPYQCGWQFRVEIEGGPTDFDFYINDITYGPTAYENEEEKLGAERMSFITGCAPVDISMTVRDNLEDQRVRIWFEEWGSKAVNPDATVNVPTKYIRTFKRYTPRGSGEFLKDKWHVIPVQLGDITESREEAGVLKFPVTLKQFRSLGAVPGRG